MIILTSVIVSLVIVYFLFRKIIGKKIKLEYEKHLVRGNKRMAIKTGRLYYNTLHPEQKKAKGIVNIDRKILEDFKTFI